jgi:hypothetical protein
MLLFDSMKLLLRLGITCSLHEDVAQTGDWAYLCVFKMWKAMKRIWINVVVEVYIYIKYFWVRIISAPVDSIQLLLYTKLQLISIDFLQDCSFYRTFMHGIKCI